MTDTPRHSGENAPHEMLLCNPWGEVENLGGQFLDLHNSMATSRQDKGFECTGGAHLCGMVIRCTNPIHDTRNRRSQSGYLTSRHVPSPAEKIMETEHSGEDARPWLLRRVGHSNGDWTVNDISTDEDMGFIFKYLGSWWVTDTSSPDNRCATRQQAAELAWARHIGGSGGAKEHVTDANKSGTDA